MRDEENPQCSRLARLLGSIPKPFRCGVAKGLSEEGSSSVYTPRTVLGRSVRPICRKKFIFFNGVIRLSGLVNFLTS